MGFRVGDGEGEGQYGKIRNHGVGRVAVDRLDSWKASARTGLGRHRPPRASGRVSPGQVGQGGHLTFFFCHFLELVINDLLPLVVYGS